MPINPIEVVSVILPAAHVRAAAMNMREQRKRADGFKALADTPEDRALANMIAAVGWLDNMDLPDAQVAVSIEAAEFIEPFLPQYTKNQPDRPE